MTDFFQDLVFALRNAFRKPATSLLIVVTLALGIGANSAMFSVAWHVLLAPLPYLDAERLVKLEQNQPQSEEEGFAWSIPTFEDYSKLNGVFSALLQYDQVPYTLLGAGDPFLAQSGVVSWNYFEVLGIHPLVGRLFVERDDATDAQQVVVLSYESWVSRFGADPDIVGTSVEVQNVSRTVIGVLPKVLPYPHYNDIWITAGNDPYRTYGDNDMLTNRSNRWVSYVFGKLRDETSFNEAAREVALQARRLALAYPDVYSEDYTVTLAKIRGELIADSGTSVVLLLGLALLVLLIASANVASLNLARIADRNQELAIRESVGASPSRIVRQLLTESMLLALIGGLAGLALAWPCLSLLSAFASGYTPLSSAVGMDASLLVFAFAISVLTGVLSGSISAFGKRDINSALKEGGDKVTSSSASVHRRQALLFMQFALSFVAVTISILVVLSLYRLNSQNLGYDPDRILAVSAVLDVHLDQSPDTFLQQFRNFSKRLLKEVNAIAGVEAVGILGGSPLLQSSRISSQQVPFDIEALPVDPDAAFNSVFNMASAGYFDVMGIALRSGRLFVDEDDENSVPVAIVNASFAERFIPGGAALGQRVHIRGEPGWKTIVGVVDSVRSRELDQLEPPTVYYNVQQWPPQIINLYVKSAGDLDELGRVVTDVVHRIDPLQPIQSLKPLNAIKADWLAPTRLRAVLIILFGLLALVVTLSGVIGVVSCNISARVREIGVHLAIGANPGNIVNMFVVQGLQTYVLGLALGCVLMLFAAPLLEPLLYKTAALDAGVFLAAVVLLTFTVVLALYLPSRRAGALSPSMALHSE